MKVWLPILAVLGLGIAVVTILVGNQQKPAAPVVVQAPAPPFVSFVAGVGILEASTENISVGTPVSGIVADLYVKWGDRVKVGDSLFKIDDRELQAALASATAQVKQAESILDKSRYHRNLAEKLGDIISKEELMGKRYEETINEAAQKVAKAKVREVRLEIDRRTVRSPILGRVLSINVRPGEFAASDATAKPLMLLGNDDVLFARVEIDEQDAWRVHPGARAVAFLRGNPAIRIPMEFLRIEPRMVPKTSLTGKSTERNDVRVLQVIYRFDRASWPVYVGQEVDVLIEAPTLEKDSR